MNLGRVRNYPWWQDLAGGGILAFVLLSACALWASLPDTLASHFDASGNPDGYISKGLTLLIMVGVHVMCWGIDVCARYQCLLAEASQKRYNWFQMLMSPFLLLNGFCWWYIVQKNTGGSGDHGLAVLTAAILVSWAYLTVTEKLREPGDFSPGPALPESEIKGKLPSRFCLVTQEAPLWWKLLTGVSGALILAHSFYLFFFHPGLRWAALILVLAGALTASMAGGFRFVVHPKAVEITLGLGIPLKTIPIQEILKVEVREFSALQDFGGLGIRLGRNKTIAFLVGGSVGLLIETKKRNYMLGTDRAATLLEAIEQGRQKVSS